LRRFPSRERRKIGRFQISGDDAFREASPRADAVI
jgi:hypothetical protein